jgi:hypothetical protein
MASIGKMKPQTHRKNAEAVDNFFVTPSFAQVMQVLALGFGLAGDRQKKLSEARSFGGKQDRYSQDLLPKLLAMLAAGDSALERDLKWRLGQMEYLLSRVRSSYLFTQIRPSKGLHVFLLVWVYPHLTALLNDFCVKVSEASPLYHLPDMLPRRNDSAYDPVKMLRRSVRAALGGDVDAPDFLRALDRLERDSSKKLSTIEDEVSALGDEIRFQFQDEEEGKRRLATVRAAYIAGIAVKRFLDMATDFDPLPLRALGACLDDEFDPKDNEHPGVLALHEALYRSMAFSLQSLMNEDSCILDELQEGYWELLKAEEPDVIPSGTNLVILFESPPLNVRAVEANLKNFFEHPQSALFEAVGLLFQGRLALYRGDLNASLVSFKLILEHAESQQLGEIAHQAAGCAIALEIMTREQVQHGSLEPLILYRAQSQKQMWEINIPLPTPFSSFGGICELPIGVRQVFEAVAEFNLDQAYMPQYPARQLCNPLARLDGLLSEFFYEHDRQRKSQAQPQKAVRKSVTLVFGRRERSVLSIYTATPYQALRDIWSLMSFFFGRELMFHEQLNVNIQRYISLRLVMQHRILKALDPVEYFKDINAAKAKRRKTYVS